MHPRKSLYNQLIAEHKAKKAQNPEKMVIALKPKLSDKDILWSAQGDFFHFTKKDAANLKNTYKFHITVADTNDYAALLDCILPIFKKHPLLSGKILNHPAFVKTDRINIRNFEIGNITREVIYTQHPFATLNDDDGTLNIYHDYIEIYKKFAAEERARVLHSIVITVYIDDTLLKDSETLLSFCEDVQAELKEANIKPGPIASSDFEINSHVSIRKDKSRDGTYVNFSDLDKTAFKDDEIIKSLVPKEILEAKGNPVEEKEQKNPNIEVFNIRDLILSIIRNNAFWINQNKSESCAPGLFSKLPDPIASLQKDFQSLPFKEALTKTLRNLSKSKNKRADSPLEKLQEAFRYLQKYSWKSYIMLLELKKEIDTFTFNAGPPRAIQPAP